MHAAGHAVQHYLFPVPVLRDAAHLQPGGAHGKGPSNSPASHNSLFRISAGSDKVCVALQSVMLVNIIYFLYLCFGTLPIYSLVVHMGKELREDAFPPELRERLQTARSHHEQVSPCVLFPAACTWPWNMSLVIFSICMRDIACMETLPIW